MATELNGPPVLSTPAENTFLDDDVAAAAAAAAAAVARAANQSDDELLSVYEIARTAAHIHSQRWRRIALQFPDAMLSDAPWVVNALAKELERIDASQPAQEAQARDHEEPPAQTQDQNTDSKEVDFTTKAPIDPATGTSRRLYILADTSYSACCVDEIAAEHADADSVVHFGRACLSPTSRLPVLHVFTSQNLDYGALATAFEAEFPEKDTPVVLIADVMFQDHVAPVRQLLQADKGYTNILSTDIVRDPAGHIPNRRLVGDANAESEPHSETDRDLTKYHLFHIATPPTSLLLTLSSRLASLRIYQTPASPYTPAADADSIPDPSMTAALLRRRYGSVLRLSSAGIIGILVNTLSVKNYMETISTLRSQIAAAGKKSYTIVVGKLNAAKLANFAEIDGWVVVGCWESGLVEQPGGMWKPVVTPFELGLALQGDETRVWTGEWWGGIEGVKLEENPTKAPESAAGADEEESFEYAEGGVSDDESAPPEFDLRTGKLITTSRPMRSLAIRNGSSQNATETSEGPGSGEPRGDKPSAALVKRAVAGEIASVNGVASPGAEFLRSQRTWQGLGTDFDGDDDTANEPSTAIEEGRSGVARGYVVGEDAGRT